MAAMTDLPEVVPVSEACKVLSISRHGQPTDRGRLDPRHPHRPHDPHPSQRVAAAAGRWPVSRRTCWRCWSVDLSSARPVPAAAPLDALDQLLEDSYGAAFERLDRLAIFDLSTEALRDRLGPFTTPEGTRCQP
jgi:hypothetical protein